MPRSPGGARDRGKPSFIAATALLGLITAWPGRADDQPARTEVIRPGVQSRMDRGDATRVWVFLRDKPADDAALTRLHTRSDPRTLERRRRRRMDPGLFDVRDLPVHPGYVRAIADTGARVHVTSRWLNAVSVIAGRKELTALASLPFVRSIEPVRSGRRAESREAPLPIDPAAATAAGGYGVAAAQLAQINLVNVHDAGSTGAGIVIGVLDSGFNRTHVAFNHPQRPLDVIAEFDFVNGDGNTSHEAGDPPNQASHGTRVLGTLAGYDPGAYIGAAYDASFILCKIEDTSSEYLAEEDNYVAALEFVEQQGGDIVTSSLVYDWYAQSQLDGLTPVSSAAVNVAISNGLICVTAAGNAGHDQDPLSSHLGAPADALGVITVGAIASSGAIASFSSDGPSADGRVKPEVVAPGVSVASVAGSADTGYTTSSGTSFATPLVAGAVATILQARPNWTLSNIREYLFETSSQYASTGTFDDRFIVGYGLIDATAVLGLDCNGNGIPDDEDIGAGDAFDRNGNGVPDDCDGDVNGDLVIDVDDLVQVILNWGCAPDCGADVNGDGQVDVDDLVQIILTWTAVAPA